MRRRLIWTFALFALGLSSLFAILLKNVYHQTEDWAYRKLLAEVMEHPDEGILTGPLTEGNLEGEYGDALGARIAELDDGYHELARPPEDRKLKQEFHVLIRSKPAGVRHVATVRMPESETAERWAVAGLWLAALIVA
ncbi:MAG: hypothetical protein AAF492_14615, partial [Verrucomicrobiota bacterium]